LRAEVAGGAWGASASGCPAARVATTGGRDGRMRWLGTGIPLPDESEEGSAAAAAGRAVEDDAVRGLGANALVADGMKGVEGDRCPAGAGGAGSTI
jgi:hypothetical protein